MADSGEGLHPTPAADTTSPSVSAGKSWNAGDSVLAMYPPDPDDKEFYNARVVQHPRGTDKYLIIYTDPDFQGDPPLMVEACHLKEAPDPNSAEARTSSDAGGSAHPATDLGADSEAMSKLDGLGIDHWDDTHRQGLLKPTKWQEQAEALQALAAHVRANGDIDEDGLHAIANVVFAKTYFESKQLGVILAILEVVIALLERQGLPENLVAAVCTCSMRCCRTHWP